MNRVLRRLRRQDGMTIFELLTVMSIVGIIANIAIPATVYTLRQARAASVLADFRTVRDAALRHNIDKGEFPAETARGVAPPELEPYLESAVSWVRYSPPSKYDWEHWVSNGEPTKPATGIAIGFSLFSNDMVLLDAVERAYEGQVARVALNQLTFLIEPTPEDG